MSQCSTGLVPVMQMLVQKMPEVAVVSDVQCNGVKYDNQTSDFLLGERSRITLTAKQQTAKITSDSVLFSSNP